MASRSPSRSSTTRLPCLSSAPPGVIAMQPNRLPSSAPPRPPSRRHPDTSQISLHADAARQPQLADRRLAANRRLRSPGEPPVRVAHRHAGWICEVSGMTPRWWSRRRRRWQSISAAFDYLRAGRKRGRVISSSSFSKATSTAMSSSSARGSAGNRVMWSSCAAPPPVRRRRSP